MVMDQMVGHVSATIGNPGVTASLSLDYRHPVPLCTPLVLRASLGDLQGRKTRAVASIALEADPDRHLVEARGLMVALTAAQVAVLFTNRA
jgi:acyl-CoA thioesterase FadM